MKKNILASTTRQWNCGDEFIFLGIQNLVKDIESNVNWVIYDRNPDIKKQSSRLSNSWDDRTLKNIDQIIIAGTPEWMKKPVEPLFKKIDEEQLAQISMAVK